MPNEDPTEPGASTLREPPRRPLRRRWWFRVLVYLAISYVAWCAVLYLCQDWLLFPADMAPDPLPSLYDATTTELHHDIEDGGKVVAWFIPAMGSAPGRPAPLVVFFHGNAEIIDHQHTTIEGYRQLGCAVLLPDYRGYGRSDGTPSEEGIVADTVHFFDEAIKRPDVDPARVVFHGRSLGGGPAAILAGRRAPNALILESTFSSAAAMAHTYFVPSFLARHPFRSDRVLESLDIPVLIFHGTHDDVIPVFHGRRLRDIARHGTYVEYDCKHNDFPGRENEQAYWRQIAELLSRAGVIEGSAR